MKKTLGIILHVIKRILKILRRILLAAVIVCVSVFFVCWACDIYKCEYLTYKYGHNFDEIYCENTMLGEIDYLKVLEYSDDYAKVYYVSKGRSGGDVLIFEKKDGVWKYTEWWDTIWSDGGNADEYIWPYGR